MGESWGGCCQRESWVSDSILFQPPGPSAGRIFAAWKPWSQVLTINKSREGLEQPGEAASVRPALSPLQGTVIFVCCTFHKRVYVFTSEVSKCEHVFQPLIVSWLCFFFPQGSQQQHLFHNTLQQILQWVEDHWWSKYCTGLADDSLMILPFFVRLSRDLGVEEDNWLWPKFPDHCKKSLLFCPRRTLCVCFNHDRHGMKLCVRAFACVCSFDLSVSF